MDILKIKKSFIAESKKDTKPRVLVDYLDEYISIKSIAHGLNQSVLDSFESIYNHLNINESIQDLFRAKVVNLSENQPALHWQCRQEDILSENDLIESIEVLKADLLSKNIKNIVNLGTGGSFEGPKLLIESLTYLPTHKFNYFFISGSDPAEIEELLNQCESSETVFIVSSKSLNTIETITNFDIAKEWVLRNNKSSKKEIMDSFFAVTANKGRAKELGFLDENVFSFAKEIGGRYSIWSAISLPAIIELGDEFIDFLSGANKADLEIRENINYIKTLKTLSFTDIWNSNFLGKNIKVILPYSWKLRSISNYLQQLEMESLGKRSHPDSVFTSTSQTIYGGFGPSAQHSYFQMLHQGTSNSAADLIYIANKKSKKSLINSQAQTQSDLFINSPEEFKGSKLEVNSNISVNLFKLSELTPFTLGYLLASWEHKVFISAQMLQINPFDQFGVEAGKFLVD
ncbi:MAG: hypothetical protein ACJ0BD_05575 [Gammaproteobacteria bacterium]